MKERSSFWDNYKGILIILVVFGHFIYDAGTHAQGRVRDILQFIYLFHMPAFIFCSGYMSRSEKACSKKSIVKLLLCYLALNTAFLVYFGVKTGSVLLLTPYSSAWYILSLVVWRLSIRHLSKIKGILPISIAMAFLIGFWAEASNLLAISRTVAFFPFFLMGYRLDESKLQKHLQQRTVLKSVFGYVFACLVAVGLLLVVRKSNCTMLMLTMQPFESNRELLNRGFIMLSATLMILTMMQTVPNRKIPLLTTVGKNSLLVYLVHRFVVFGFNSLFPASEYSSIYLLYALLATAAVVLIFGSDFLNKWFYKVLDWLSEEITNEHSKAGKRIVAAILAGVLLISGIPLAKKAISTIQPHTEEPAQVDVSEVIDDSIILSFVGDLVLLKDQVESAYDPETGEYLFDPMFEYVKDYLAESDLTIGVLEGPVAGAEKGYTTSDFSDRARLYMNFPDSFAQAIKDAGIDVVTTANNHLMDMGAEGALRTLDVLDDLGLKHTGSYRNQAEKDEVFLVEVQGIKIAMLSYTFYINQCTMEEMIEKYSYITSMLPSQTDPYFSQLMKQIEGDFEKAEASGADLIVVLPHMGTQFSHETDEFQDFWNRTFSELGADIILGDHVQVVQPIEQIGDTIIVNCPGNFADSYIQKDGDANSIVEIYIDPTTKKPEATAIVPLYSQEMKNGYFRPVPIYEILTQTQLYEQMKNIELKRISEAQALITEVMLGKKIGTTNVQPRYFYIDGKYCPMQYSLLDEFPDYWETQLHQMIDSAATVVYVGDSITSGSGNGGHPWYEPLMTRYGEKTVVNISQSDCTAGNILRSCADALRQSNGDLYIVSVGANDIRYRDEEICAMTPQEYVSDVDELVALILETNPNAKIVLLSPWMTLANDRDAVLDYAQRLDLITAYTEALSVYAQEQSCYFLNPNQVLETFFETHQQYQYTNDGVNPNSTKGIDLYSWAVMQSSRNGAE